MAPTPKIKVTKQTNNNQPQTSVLTSNTLIDSTEDFAADLIKDINKSSGTKIAFNLSNDDSPTNVKRWIGSGSRQLDYIVSNKSVGGLPEGRIIEIQGPPSIGKSHLGFLISRHTQLMGGIVVYIDTENATNPENLKALGVSVSKNFVFIQETCMEEIFKVIESTIEKARNLKNNVPVTIIWDSVAASSPKAELDGDYDQNTIGLGARVLSKGFRKLTHTIGDKNILLVLMQQQRQKIGVLYGDPNTTPGGMAIPYHASVRIKLTGGQQIKQTINGKEVVIGINVSAKTIKNKVARPWREVDFEIHFGKGIFENEQIFDTLREYCDKTTNPVVFNGMRLSVEGTGAWKTFTVADNTTGEVVCEEKFYKSEFGEKILNNPKHKTYINALMDAVYIMSSTDENHTTFSGVDTSSNEEVQAAELENNSDKKILLD